MLFRSADCTFLNYYQASCYRSMEEYQEFAYQPDGNLTQSIALGVTRESNPALFRILSKSLQRIEGSSLQSILNENTTRTERLTLRLLIRRYPVEATGVTALFGTLVGLLVLLLATAGARKRRNVRLAAAIREADAANRAKSDFLSRMEERKSVLALLALSAAVRDAASFRLRKRK